jgi:hypothetical protein
MSRRILSGDQGMIVWWSIGAGVHVEPHSHPNEQISGCSKGRWSSASAANSGSATSWSFREVEHEEWFPEDTEVIDFFAPPRADFPVGGKPAYMSEG